MNISRAARRVGAAALLGLPAALLAHTLVFGGEHAAGGSMHALLFGLAASFGFLTTLLVAIAATRSMRGAAPRLWPVLSGAVVWYGATELYEHAHAVPVLLSVLALVLASAIVHAVLRAFAHTIVAIACSLWSALAKPKSLCASAIALAMPALQRPAYRFRVFSRPPPVLS